MGVTKERKIYCTKTITPPLRFRGLNDQKLNKQILKDCHKILLLNVNEYHPSFYVIQESGNVHMYCIKRESHSIIMRMYIVKRRDMIQATR